MFRISEILRIAKGKPLRIVFPAVYAALFMLLLAFALIESFLPFTINIPPIYTADIPLCLYLAYLISYPGVYLALLLDADSASLIFLLIVFVLSLSAYMVLGFIIDLLKRK